MAIFQVEIDLPKMEATLSKGKYTNHNVSSLVETFIVSNFEETKEFIQLLSVSPVTDKMDAVEPSYFKTVFRLEGTMESVTGKVKIGREEYYEHLLSLPNETLEQKMQVLFTRGDVNYSVTMTNDLKYCTLEMESITHEEIDALELLRDLPFLTIRQEINYSLEEAFCRLYLSDEFIDNDRVFGKQRY